MYTLMKVETSSGTVHIGLRLLKNGSAHTLCGRKLNAEVSGEDVKKKINCKSCLNSLKNFVEENNL
ncbi:MAG: hypothetical protein ACLFWL_06405 [Candidatus Brocadiia bacterium]|nr:hypothetical protein [Planctomycetota bacterium]